MDESINRKLADSITMHQVNLERVKSGLDKKAKSVFRQLEKNLKTEIIKADPTGVTAPSYRQARMKKLLTQTRATLSSTYKRMSKDMRLSMKELAATEGAYHQQLINKHVGVEIASVAVSKEMIESIVNEKNIIGGTKAADWWMRQSVNLQRRFESTIQEGMLRGEPLQDLVKRVAGTKKNDYKDGIMQTTIRQAAMLIRTSVQTVANDARNQLYAANTDVVKAVQHISTLDSRTTPICQERSNKIWSLPDYQPVGHSIPWLGGPGGSLHWGCRSTTAPVLKSWEELGADGIKTDGRPSHDTEAYFKKRYKERLEKLYAKDIQAGATKNGMPIEGWIQKETNRVIMNAQSSMDGVDPEALNYEAWLIAKPIGFQQEVIGIGK